MPRTMRASVGGLCYHVINRGNARACVFHDSRDFHSFVSLMRQACVRIPMRIPAWCLMPNHFHFVLWPYQDGDLGSWMHWLLTSHVRRHHKRRGTDGRIWQGRFKAFPIEQDVHLLTVMRYAGRNPLRANLIERAEQWPWSSLHEIVKGELSISLETPVERPGDWVAWTNEPQSTDEEAALRLSIKRSRPYGGKTWILKTATALGLEQSLQNSGPRVRKSGT